MAESCEYLQTLLNWAPFDGLGRTPVVPARGGGSTGCLFLLLELGLLISWWKLDALRLRKGDGKEDCFQNQEDECDKCRNSIEIQLDTPRGNRVGKGSGSEVCADGWAEAEWNSEGNSDVGEGLGAVNRCRYIREYGAGWSTLGRAVR